VSEAHMQANRPRAKPRGGRGKQEMELDEGAGG
jgi:hypothetical protein